MLISASHQPATLQRVSMSMDDRDVGLTFGLPAGGQAHLKLQRGCAMRLAEALAAFLRGEAIASPQSAAADPVKS